MSNFTEEQIKNYHTYKEVREMGTFNMSSHDAQAMTGLDKEDYMFCMRNYILLRIQAERETA